MKGFFELLIVVLLGLGLGGSLSWVSIQENHGFGALEIGQWTAWPLAGSPEADPYTKAKVAAEGEVPLGAAEGIAFHALRDQRSEKLLRQCQYALTGLTPAARFWTLAAHDIPGETFLSGKTISRPLLSHGILRETDGRFTLQVGPVFAQGNWMPVQGRGPYQLVLRLYDSPVTSTGGVVASEMPEIEFLGCNS